MAADQDAGVGQDAPSGAASGAELTRGEFLTKATIGVGGLLGAMIGVPVAGMALAPAVAGTKFPRMRLGDVSDFPDGQWVKVVLNPNPEAEDSYVRKRVAFVRHNKDPKADAFAPEGQGEYTVVSNRCAHLGCPVTQSGEGFVCPCHGGAYDSKGAREAGPPTRPLDRFEWELDGDTLWAVDEYSLTNKGKRKAVHGPGQHAGGPEGWLYPVQPSQL